MSKTYIEIRKGTNIFGGDGMWEWELRSKKGKLLDWGEALTKMGAKYAARRAKNYYWTEV